MPHDWDSQKVDTCTCLGCQFERAMVADKAKREEMVTRDPAPNASRPMVPPATSRNFVIPRK